MKKSKRPWKIQRRTEPFSTGETRRDINVSGKQNRGSLFQGASCYDKLFLMIEESSKNTDASMAIVQEQNVKLVLVFEESKRIMSKLLSSTGQNPLLKDPSNLLQPIYGLIYLDYAPLNLQQRGENRWSLSFIFTFTQRLCYHTRFYIT
ncbi:hypothetical protein TWF225_001805 [Orbilia oligospora]|nr:hypothetical protein TWF225_001805 [Orbilia oligospora]KAF3262314.1 hypothetical protein TWF217_004380 [Orbilia oligospora]KAF3265188.1 hypothetical protein TWF128_000476 [Orbilia oligospora]KAF3293740.1 hypothetical protein TWF132_004332 [Orbilia oligospora]